ncbi:MAG: pyrroloquinoline quinone biosynthesis protein PqqB [Nevskia sp.]|nr:pyrroloquinoline quinone biosynthesis protein PqqB [Nevskia sp.]
MKIRILGSAAGGGFPQWNCNCETCDGCRSGRLNAIARTQSSIAVSANGQDWVLINASPDIRAQILANPTLQPNRSLRDTGIKAVFLMDAQIDHVTGLLMLRESKVRLPIYCSARVKADLTSGFPIFNILEHYCGVDWFEVKPDGTPFAVPGIDGIQFEPFALTSKAPPYSPHRAAPVPGDNLGLVIRNTVTGKCVLYAPGLGVIEPPVEKAMRAADLILVDGTTWTDDEMSRRGVGKKLAREMGHLYQSGPGGMLEVLSAYPSARRVLIHINNTNPILIEDGPERAEVRAAGVEVAQDGLVFEL